MLGFYDWIKLTNISITYIMQKSKSLKLIYIAYSPLLIRELQFEFVSFTVKSIKLFIKKNIYHVNLWSGGSKSSLF